MKIFNKNTDYEPVFIAEIGVNHEGDLNAAKGLLSLAKSAGYDAAKFQLYQTESFLSNHFGERVDRAKKFCLTKDQYGELVAMGRDLDIFVFGSAISHDVVDILAKDGVIKIASGDIDFNYLLKCVAKTDCKIILSIGASTLAEVENAISVLSKASKSAIKGRLVLMVCTSQYPCSLEDANINRIRSLEQLGFTIGFSNHVIEEEAAFSAAALGACVFEFHFTDTHDGKEFHDHLLSFTPSQSIDVISTIKKIRLSLGNNAIKRTATEEANHLMLRKGLVYSESIDIGATIKSDSINFARPAVHFKANEIETLLNKRLIKKVYKGDLIMPDDFE